MLMSCIPEPALQSCDIGQRIVFLDRCQLIITWSSNSKLETDSIFLGLPASKFAISHPLTSRGGRSGVGAGEGRIKSLQLRVSGI